MSARRSITDAGQLLQGVFQRTIGEQLGLNRETVRRYIRAGTCPERATRAYSALADPFHEVPKASVSAILADYDRLADAHPEAKAWPRWVFKIVQAMVQSGRQQDAWEWMQKLVDGRPDLFWRANREALIDPASVKSGQ